jgi:hypothetical protein
VIPRGGGDHAPSPFLGAELRDQIHPAPNLESSYRLIVFMLDVHFGAHQSVDGWIAV